MCFQMGEMYMGQALATITDSTVTPTECLTPAVALFMFVITIIGGNVPLLIPLVSSAVGYQGDVDISFQAASVYNATITGQFCHHNMPVHSIHIVCTD